MRSSTGHPKGHLVSQVERQLVSQREGKGSAKEEISWAACENVANQPMRISAENAIRRLGAQLVEKNVYTRQSVDKSDFQRIKC